MASGGSPVWALVALLSLLPLVARGERAVGALDEVPVSNPGVQEAARFALEAYNRASNSMFCYKPVRVLKAETQVVSGMKYYLTVEIVNTRCEKKVGCGLKNVGSENCAVPSEAEQKQICEFVVWSRPWMQDTRLSSISCTPSSS
uniref:Cystatin-POGU1 n=1 Tax=Pogona vitticeps TaxID=103695 RepID=A0A6J0UBX0_9SAUR